MTHAPRPLDAHDDINWHEEEVRERRLGLWVLIGLNIAASFVGFCIGWTIGDFVSRVLP
jgi:hypothetical protein